MRGKTGQWGKPFTRENANTMRLRGLETRRFNAEKRLARALCGGEPTAAIRHEQLAGPAQPSKPPESDAAKLSPTVERKPAHTHAAPAPVAQAGGVVCYGYELSPGVWVDAKPPARNPNGLTEAAVLRARRMFPRRWNGERPSGKPR